MPLLLSIAAQWSHVPPVVQVRPAGAVQALIDFEPSSVTCDGGSVAPLALARPIPVASSVPAGRVIASSAFTFTIDASGRPLGIAPDPRPGDGVPVPSSDLQPALAASRFVPASARRRCTISYAPIVVSVADAPIALVQRYLALPHDRSYFEAAINARVRAAAPGCFTGRGPAVLLRGYPDFDSIPQPAGALSMTVVQFDIDRAGRPVKIRTMASDGNAALDAGGRAAVARSRFGKEARTGCTYPYYRRQALPLAPPEGPSLESYRKTSACGGGEGAWDVLPRLTFPEPFRRRAIEGWAVIRYDVAPWGQTGNVTVLASEPAAMFGDSARSIIQAAKRPASSTGATGCIERVRFKLPESASGMAAPSPPIGD